MMRQYNQKLILRVLKDHGPLSKTQLSHITQLTIPAISDILEELSYYNLIEDSGQTPIKRGRFPILQKLNADAYKIVGITIESETIETAIVNLNGDIFESVTVPLPTLKTPESVVNEVYRSVHIMFERSNLSRGDLIGAGLGMHGIVDPVKGISIYPPHLNWGNVPIAKLLEDKLKLPVKVDNDCNTKALAERWFGEGKDVESFIIVNIDYGIGAGIMLRDQLFYGGNYGAGQIGHTVVKDDGPLCSCGNYGCLEAIASEPALLKEVVIKVKKGFPTKILELAGTPENISIEHLYEAAKLNDRMAVQLLESAGRFSGIAISTLVNLFNPQRVFITGGILKGGKHVLTPLYESVKQHSLKPNIKDLNVTPSKLGEAANVLGATTLWINELFSGNTPLEKVLDKRVVQD